MKNLPQFYHNWKGKRWYKKGANGTYGEILKCPQTLINQGNKAKSSVLCASGSVVERLLAKEKVAGSIPVSRFFYYMGSLDFTGFPFLLSAKKL